MSSNAEYLMAGQSSELERLRLQSRVWEPAGRALLQRLPAPPAARARRLTLPRTRRARPAATS